MSEQFIRSLIANRLGGATFDQGGSYVFTEMINAENELEKSAVEGDPSTAVLRFSVADPVLKMEYDNFQSGIDHFEESVDSSRYTDLNGIRNFDFMGRTFENTQDCIAFLLNKKFDTLTFASKPITSEMVQYTYDGIKGPLSTHVTTAFFDSDSVIIMPDPSYGVIASEVNRMDAEVVKIPIQESSNGSYSMKVSTLEDLFCKNKQTFAGKKVFLYVNVPHNPTGLVYNRRSWNELMNWAGKNNIMLIVDEAYIDLDYSGSASSVLEIPGWYNNAIVLQSVSKAHKATGLRFGWICAHPVAIKAIRKVIDNKNSGAFAPVIKMGLSCLSDVQGRRKTKLFYEALHHLLSESLVEAGFEDHSTVPQSGLCQLTRFPKKAVIKTDPQNVETVSVHEFKTSTEFANWLRQKLRISVMPQDALGKIRWAVTFRPDSRFGLNSEEEILKELGRRLGQYEFDF